MKKKMRKQAGQREEQFYVLKSGRVVRQGDSVEVRLTPRMIKFFLEIGVIKPAEGKIIKVDSFEDVLRLIGVL